MNEILIDDFLVQLPCMDERVVEKTKESVHRLKDRWIERYMFHTIGMTTHLDHPKMGGPKDFAQKVEIHNGLIKESFSDALECIVATLTSYLGDPVHFCSSAPFPGLPIYSNFLHTPIKDRTHIDLQFELLDWSMYGGVDFDNAITVTLPIELPSYSSGIRFWPQGKRSDIVQTSQIRPKPITFRGASECKYFPYEVGKLVVHNGFFAHAIDNYSNLYLGNFGNRITIQCHGLFCDGAWRLYW